MVGGERLEQERPVRKRKQEHVVLRVEFADELRNSGAQLLELGLHAARGVSQDSDRYRGVEVLAQELQWPLDAVDVDAKIAFLQASNVPAVLVGHRDGHLLVA